MSLAICIEFRGYVGGHESVHCQTAVARRCRNEKRVLVLYCTWPIDKAVSTILICVFIHSTKKQPVNTSVPYITPRYQIKKRDLKTKWSLLHFGVAVMTPCSVV